MVGGARQRPSTQDWPCKDSEIEVEWRTDYWYPAVVMDVVGEGDERRLKVRWHDWPKKKVDTLRVEQKIRAPLGAAVCELERVLKKYGTTEGARIVDDEVVYDLKSLLRVRSRGRLEYLVEWVGPYPHTWEAADDIHPEWIEAFETAQQSRSEEKSKGKRAVRRKIAHCVEVAGSAPQHVRTLRADDARFVQEAVGMGAARTLRKQRERSKAPHVLFRGPISEEFFLALHDRLRRIVETLKLPRDPSEHVSDITAIKGSAGGHFIVDQFKVTNIAVVRELLGAHSTDGYIYLHSKTLALALVPPLRFQFLSTQGGGNGAPPVATLRVLGHFAAVSVTGKKNGKKARYAYPKFVDQIKEKTKKVQAQKRFKLTIARGLRRLGVRANGIVKYMDV